MRRSLLLAAIAATLLVAAPGSASAFTCTPADDFNRANSSSLGANWTESGGDLMIFANHVAITQSQEGYALYNAAPSSAACMDVAGAASGGVGIILRHVSSSSAVQVLVQDLAGNDGQFDTVTFRSALGSGTFATANLTPFMFGSIYAAVEGSKVALVVNGGAQTVVRSGAPQNGGTTVGISGFSNVSIDNFATANIDDNDADTVGNLFDSCPAGVAAGLDTDGDGCKDVMEDADDDNDGVLDTADGCPAGVAAGLDTDGDGCKDAMEDANDDNDGVLDTADSCPTVPATTDANGDGCTDPPPATATVKCSKTDVTIAGTPAGETITGTPERDVIAGVGGRDKIKGLGGDDVICGNSGNDRLFGGRGADVLRGGKGRDRLVGGPGDDALNPGKGGGGGGPKDTLLP